MEHELNHTKQMEHLDFDKLIAFAAGMFGGFIKYISATLLLDATFIGKLFEAGITALVCGYLGVAGKHLYNWVSKKIKNKKR